MFYNVLLYRNDFLIVSYKVLCCFFENVKNIKIVNEFLLRHNCWNIKKLIKILQIKI